MTRGIPSPVGRSRPIYVILLVLSALGAAAISLFIFSPRFVFWQGIGIPEAEVVPEVNRAVSTLKQLQSPFAPIPNPSNAVIHWRLLFPLLAHVLHLPIVVFLALPPLGAVLTLMLVTHLTLRETGRWTIALATTLLFATTSWFFVSMGWLTYFDSWLALGLLLATFTRVPLVLAVVCLLTPWVDERFVLAMPLVLLSRAVLQEEGRKVSLQALKRDSVLVLLTVLPYLAIRIIAYAIGRDAVSGDYVSTHLEFLKRPVSWRVWGAWEGLRATWIFVIAYLWLAASSRRPWWSVLVIGTVAVTTIGSSIIAGDLSRSIIVVLPASLAGVFLLHRRKPRYLKVVLPVALAANLLLPASHVIVTFSVPVAWFPTELASFENPPSALNADSYVRRGSSRLKARDIQGARSDFDTAIHLDPANLQALLSRGGLLASTGDVEGAIRDVEEVLRIAPPDWPQYSDVDRYRSRLQQMWAEKKSTRKPEGQDEAAP